jgi:hypothetical protein
MKPCKDKRRNKPPKYLKNSQFYGCPEGSFLKEQEETTESSHNFATPENEALKKNN